MANQPSVEDFVLVDKVHKTLVAGEKILRQYQEKFVTIIPTLLPEEKEWAEAVVLTASHFAAAHFRLNFVRAKMAALCNIEHMRTGFDDLRKHLRAPLVKFRDMSNDDFDDWEDEDAQALIASDLRAWRVANEEHLREHFNSLKGDLDNIQCFLSEIVKLINLFC
jgi:hypothetical protein